MSEFEKKSVVKVEIDSAEAIKRLATLEQQQRALRVENKELSKSFDENSEAIAANNAKISLLGKESTMLKNTLAQTEKATKSATGSIDQLSAKLLLATKSYNALSEEQRNSKGGIELKKQIDQLTASLKENSTQLDKQKLNIGNYPEALGGAIKSINVFGINIGEASEKLSTGAKASKEFIGGIANTKGALTALVAIPVVAFLVGLVALLKKTQAGQEGLRKGFAAAGAVVDVLVSKVVSFTTSVVEAFSKPGELLEDFKNLLSDLAEKQLANFLAGIQGIGSAFKKLFAGQFKEAFTEAGNALLKLNPASALVEKVTGAVTKLGKELFDAGKNAFDLEGQIIGIEKQSRNLVTTLAKLNAEYEKQQAIADDATRSFAERERAADKSRKIAAEQARIQTQLAQAELDILNRQLAQKQKLGLFDQELADQQREATLKLIEVQGAYQKVLIDNEKQRRELVQDRLEKDLDILIDGFDNQKTINERIIADEEQVFEKRRELLARTTELAQESFDRQIQTIQQFTGKAIDANDLLATADAKALNEKIRGLGLSEVIEGRLLEVIRERRIAVQDLIDDEKALREAERGIFFASQDQANDRLTQFFENRLTRQKEALAEGKILESDFQAQQLADELLYLESKLSLNEKFEEQILENTKLTEKEKQEAIKQISEENLKLRQSAADKEFEIAKQNAEKQRQIQEATFSATTSFVDGVSSLFDLLAANQEQATELQKVAALAQIAIDTAKAISSLVAAANQNPLNGPTFGAAGVAQFAAGIAQILANIAKAKQLLSFETGGNVSDAMAKQNGITVGGRRHAQGGTVYTGEDGNAFEVEQGEQIFVLKRNDSARIAALSFRNTIRGGVPFFAAGGSPSAGVGGGTVKVDTSGFENAVQRGVERARTKQPIVQVSQLQRVTNAGNRVKVSSSLKTSK